MNREGVEKKMNTTENNFSALQDLYKTSSEKVRKIKLDPVQAQKKYFGYVQFVKNFTKPETSLLDVGCGSGWSTHFLAQEGFQSTGVDLHADGFEPEPKKNLKYQTGSVLELPFADHTFAVTATNECLEHVPSPEKALGEMVRVTEPGGLIIVVGPNLLSIGLSLKALTLYVWQQRPIRRIFWREESQPRHPLGNTLVEVLFYLIRNVFLIFYKLLRPSPHFKMREPDLRPPFHADSDSCYLLNPIDLKKYFSDTSRFKIIHSGALNRPKSVELIAAGTWFCVQKIEDF